MESSTFDGFLFGGVAGGLASATREALALKANIDSPSFTGEVQCSNLQIASDGSLIIPDDSLPISVTNGLQEALDIKANDASIQAALAQKADLGGAAYFSSVDGSDFSTYNLTADGAITFPQDSLSIAHVYNLQPTLNSKAPLASPSFTGTVSGVTKAMVGLGNADNTSDLNKPVSSATQIALDLKANQASTQAALDLKAPLASPSFTGTVSGVSKAMVGLDSVDNTSDLNKPVSSATQTALNLKANLASPTFTGTVGGITAPMVGLGAVDNTSDLNKPVSSATQTALNLKANLASPTFTGTVGGISAAMVGLGNVSNTSDASKPVSTATQAALDLKANVANPTFTGTVGGITKGMVGLGSVDNTSDISKPVSTATQTALDLKANLLNPTFTGTVGGITKGMVGLGSVDNTSDITKPVSTATQTALDLKANLLNPTFTGTVGGITKGMVGLGSVDNTSDTSKPVSTATQTALDLKANLLNPTFTGTVGGITKGMVGLGSVDNTSDANKPVSTATQTALDLKANLASPAFTGTVTGVTKAMVGLGSVDNTSDASKPVSSATQTALNLKANLASPAFTGTVTGISKSMVGLANVDNTSDASKPISSATQTALNSKANTDTFALPNGTGYLSTWHQIGTLTTSQSGCMCKLEFITQHYYSANPVDSVTAELWFSTSNNTNSQPGWDTTAFYGAATCTVAAGYGFDKNALAVQQYSPTSYGFFVYMLEYAGRGMVRVTTNQIDTFTYSGAMQSPTACSITPTYQSVDLNTQSALDLKANLESPVFTGTVTGVTKAMVGLGSVDNTSDASKPVSSATQTALNLKANLASPAFTGTVTGISKAMVGLGSVDNTSDASKPVSSATQTALNLKANLASPAFTGTVTGISKTMVGLGNVDNTSDANKPVSTAVQTALDQKLSLITNSSFYQWTRGIPSVSSLLISHTTGIQFAVDGLVPTSDAAVFLTVDNTGISTPNANVIGNLTVGGVASFSGNMTAKQITAAGDLLFGVFGSDNTLTFRVSGTGVNNIVVNTSNQMLMTNNSINWLRSDGATCNIYSDLNVFSNTASANKRLTVESQGTGGTPYITLKARNTTQGSLYLTNTSLFVASETAGVPTAFTVNNSGTTLTPLQLYANGVVNVGNSAAANKQLVLFENAAADAPSTATNFFGFGVNSATLRYQVNQSTATHKFYCGSTLAYTISNTGGANGSDARWKTEVQNITGALDKIEKLQGKTFILNDNPDRKMGFIAQEVKEIIPEVIYIDENDPDQYHFLQYDRLTALLTEGVKELLGEVRSLKLRVATLEAAAGNHA